LRVNADLHEDRFLISVQRGFLFIHIPKTAGNAIQNVLRQYSEERVVTLADHQDGVERFEVRSDNYEIRKHSSLAEYRAQLGGQVIDSLFRFTCVRNTWERMISAYFSPHRGAVTWSRARFVDLVKKTLPVSHYVAHGNGAESIHDRFGQMDFYMRFDQLDHDFKRASAQIGITYEHLVPRNVGPGTEYAAYYDEELVDLVRQRFQEEIQYFEFQPPKASDCSGPRTC